ncbi:MAG TPA: hypothetical protein VGK00_06640 [Anaerolineales bacterium]|jgi:hypothetical protein
MRRGNLFWGLILILLGVLFFLQASRIITDVLGWFWPLAILLLGLWLLASRFLPGNSAGGETFSIDLQGAARLNLELDHGAGSVFIGSGTPAGVAVTGSQGGGLEIKSARTADSLDVSLSAGPSFLPFIGPEGGEWRFNLNSEVPVSIKLDAGASSLNLDLTGLKLAFLGVETGASSIKVKLPVAAGYSLVDIQAGAASIDLTVPAGVGARIRSEHGVSTVNIDTVRFPQMAGMPNFYQSLDYDSAPNKVEVNFEGGASSVNLR